MKIIISIFVLLVVGCSEAIPTAKKKKDDEVVSMVDLLKKDGFPKFIEKKYSDLNNIFNTRDENRYISVFEVDKQYCIIISQPDIMDIKWISDIGKEEIPVNIVSQEKIIVSGILLSQEGDQMPDFTSSSEAKIGYKFEMISEMSKLKISYPNGHAEIINIRKE